MRLEAADLYQVRRARLQAERKVLLAQMAQNEARMLLLELEHKYGLLSTDAVLDVESGRVTTPCPELVERHPGLVEGGLGPKGGSR